MAKPQAEIVADPDLIRSLLAAQHPHLANEPIQWADEGWDNFMFRLGALYAVRVPRRRIAVDLLLHEQRWLPVIAPRLPIQVPVPIAIGVPSDQFAWPWSVVPWILGETADKLRLNVEQAEPLAKVLRALHQEAPDEAPSNPFRGGPLHAKQSALLERLERLHLNELRPAWSAAALAPTPNEKCWLHGDLHPRNIVLRDGALAGIIDWGDITAGDRATDLACAWMVFDSPRSREAFLEAYCPDEDTRLRARGWAIHLASLLLDSREPQHIPLGQAAISELFASIGGGAP